ncbi:FK506-binding protein 5-like [Artemia franciscana]|uniref:Ras-associating domain-containing protein n=1 Tax=Artemia franciscana TaxID=6661 RepID=A0AA88I8T4_ARTSF|nr:hypothetical protein QYM36_000698 [Artemia franciscana]
MELKVWVDGIQRVVCGVTEKTTCQDVVYALAHAIGQTGRFTLIERWRHNERLLAPQDHPLKVLMKWGEYAGDVQFILQRTPSDPVGSTRTTPRKSPQPLKDLKKALTFSGGHAFVNGVIGINNTVVTNGVGLDSENHCENMTNSNSSVARKVTLPSSVSPSSGSGSSSDGPGHLRSALPPPYRAPPPPSFVQRVPIPPPYRPPPPAPSLRYNVPRAIVKAEAKPVTFEIKQANVRDSKDRTLVQDVPARDSPNERQTPQISTATVIDLSRKKVELSRRSVEQRKNLSYLNERIQTYEDEVSKIDKNSQEFEEVHHEVVSERLRLQNTLDSLLSEENRINGTAENIEDEVKVLQGDRERAEEELSQIREELSRIECQITVNTEKIRLLSEQFTTEEDRIHDEAEELRRTLSNIWRDTSTYDQSIRAISEELEQVESTLFSRRMEEEHLVNLLREANLESLTLSTATEEHSRSLWDGAPRGGSVRRILGSPRQLENAAPTPRNPQGVWV